MELFSPQGIMFVISDLFRIYVVYRFIGIFVDRREVNRKLEILVYLGYFLVHAFVFMAFNIMPLTMVTNVIVMFAIMFLYKNRLSTKVLTTLLIYATGLCVEGMVFVCLQAVGFDGDMTNMVLFVGSLVILLIVLIIERARSKGMDREIKSKNWVALLYIPIASVFISLVLSVPLTQFKWVAAAMFFLLTINFISFYLYDALGKYYVEESEKQLLVQQNEAYTRQFELIQQSQDSIRILRHDMKNHMMTLNSLVESGDQKGLVAYMKKINANIGTQTIHADTGNHYVDSILNYKIEEAIRAGAQVQMEVHIPDKLNIVAFDLNVIIGNLMDNAIEGIKETEDKTIYFEMALDRSMLFIKVKNHFLGSIKRRNGEFLSTKSNNRLRGIGLRSVQSAVGLYDGTMDIDVQDGVFTVNVLLYNQSHSSSPVWE